MIVALTESLLRLLGESAVVPAYYGRAPRGTPMPYITFETECGYDNSMCDYGEIARVEFAVWSGEDNLAEVALITQSLREIVERGELVIAGARWVRSDVVTWRIIPAEGLGLETGWRGNINADIYYTHEKKE